MWYHFAGSQNKCLSPWFAKPSGTVMVILCAGAHIAGVSTARRSMQLCCSTIVVTISKAVHEDVPHPEEDEQILRSTHLVIRENPTKRHDRCLVNAFRRIHQPHISFKQQNRISAVGGDAEPLSAAQPVKIYLSEVSEPVYWVAKPEMPCPIVSGAFSSIRTLRCKLLAAK